jgi:hypothetical protein
MSAGQDWQPGLCRSGTFAGTRGVELGRQPTARSSHQCDALVRWQDTGRINLPFKPCKHGVAGGGGLVGAGHGEHPPGVGGDLGAQPPLCPRPRISLHGQPVARSGRCQERATSPLQRPAGASSAASARVSACPGMRHHSLAWMGSDFPLEPGSGGPMALGVPPEGRAVGCSHVDTNKVILNWYE